MWFLIRKSRRPTAGVRTLLASVAMFALLPACDQRDTLPTSPPFAAPITPKPAMVVSDVTRLPTLGGSYTNAIDINDAGQVVGVSSLALPGVVHHAFLWTLAGGMQDLGTLGGTYSVAYAINQAGEVVGMSRTPGDVAPHAFLWSSGHGMRDLGTLGGTESVATGINDKGAVVGYSDVAGNANQHAFIWTRAEGMQDLGTLAGGRFNSRASDINNAGQVVGASAVAEYVSRPFLWTAGEGMRDLGSFGGTFSGATAINEAGEIVGYSNRPTDVVHAFLWTPAAGMRDLGTLSGVSHSEAHDINEAGQVFGLSNAVDGEHGFVWTATDGMQDLFPNTGMMDVRAVNNRGQVINMDRLAKVVFETNRAPVSSVGGPYTGTEGSAMPLALSGSDLDGDALTYSWDLGDGSTGTGPAPPVSHTYVDDGTYGVRLSVSDGKGGHDTKTTTATIANVAPAIPAGGLTGPAAALALVTGTARAPITLAFTDPAGVHDTYAADIHCGNGTVLAATAITSPYTATCTYSSAGVYVVRAGVTDEDGGTSADAFYRYVVIYDPEGAFTTGSGFYAISGKTNGRASKAHFTFSVKFLPGRPTAPNGTARFWIPGGDIDMESTAIEVLVVSGSRVQFWGSGMSNGAPVRFRITAVDGDLAVNGGTADAFRIEIWNAATTLLDTQPGAAQDAPVTTPVAGGNIEIHRD